jgi:hypothetical protein
MIPWFSAVDTIVLLYGALAAAAVAMAIIAAVFEWWEK